MPAERIEGSAHGSGETGGIAHHYFHHCVFENTVRGDAKARYPGDSGHGFRTNGACRGLVFEDCIFRGNGGYGVQVQYDNTNNVTVRRNLIDRNYYGGLVALSISSNFVVYSNVISNNANFGLQSGVVNGAKYLNNTVYNNKTNSGVAYGYGTSLNATYAFRNNIFFAAAGNGVPSSNRLSGPPGQYSIEKYGRPSNSPTS